MLLADIPIPSTLIVPDQVKQYARGVEIETSFNHLPFGADAWIGCRYAWPHVDKFWDLLFLTLSITSSHEAGDALTDTPLKPVPRGRLFVVDPRVAHWLADENSWKSTRTRPWVGLQWEVPREKAKAQAQRIVRELGGKWLNTVDKRYIDWAPKPTDSPQDAPYLAASPMTTDAP